MANPIKVKRGNKTNLPTLNQGEFGFCTDEKELYIGDGTTNFRVLTSPRWLNIVIDGGGSAITTGVKGYIVCPAFDIEEVWLLGSPSGSIQIDIWKDSYANFPPTVADSLCDASGASAPAITSGQKYQDTTLTDWVTAVSEGDILAINVDSCTDVELCTLAIKMA